MFRIAQTERHMVQCLTDTNPWANSFFARTVMSFQPVLKLKYVISFQTAI